MKMAGGDFTGALGSGSPGDSRIVSGRPVGKRDRRFSGSGRIRLLISLFLPGVLVAGCSDRSFAEPENIAIEVIEDLPHDNRAFTQGFLYHGGSFYESTGQYGESTLRRVEPRTGEVEKIRYLPDHLFGEGLALLGDRLFQATWKAGRGFIYDIDSFDRVGEFSYEGEGWGLTTDGSTLILSDGSSVLRFLDPRTFEVVRRLTVRDHRGEVPDLNELEYIDGAIFANRWYGDEIVRISPDSGEVTGVIRLAGRLRPRPTEEDSVLNGIAWDAERRILYLTGKRWPRVFALRFVETP